METFSVVKDTKHWRPLTSPFTSIDVYWRLHWRLVQPTRKHLCLFNHNTCILVQQEYMYSCSTRIHVFLFNKNTYSPIKSCWNVLIQWKRKQLWRQKVPRKTHVTTSRRFAAGRLFLHSSSRFFADANGVALIWFANAMISEPLPLRAGVGAGPVT